MANRPGHRKRKLFSSRYVHPERRRSRNWALILFGSVAMFFALQRYVIGAGIVTDVSMLPTLREGSYFLINKYIYHTRPPRRGEIVVFRKSPLETEYYVKRVVALEGEEVSLRAGRVRVNGRPLEEPYAHGPTYPDTDRLVIPKGSCFLLGDNRTDSEDSRHFGCVALERIEGKLTPDRLFPLN
ncbi:MAG: signal peptidase I [Candidatus Omnitrophica bacterium]|nr:signal peptidase I [Candidatus Omnitrophota bacterium]